MTNNGTHDKTSIKASNSMPNLIPNPIISNPIPNSIRNSIDNPIDNPIGNPIGNPRATSLKSEKVFKAARYVHGTDKGAFFLKVVPCDHLSIGIVATKKIGCAVERNYMKRRVRHAFHIASRNIPYHPKIALVAIIKKECMRANFDKIVKGFEIAMKAHCTSSS